MSMMSKRFLVGPFLFLVMLSPMIICSMDVVKKMHIACVLEKDKDNVSRDLVRHLNYLSQKGHKVTYVFDNELDNNTANINTYDIFLCVNGLVGKKVVDLKERYDFSEKVAICFLGPDVTSNEVTQDMFYDTLFAKGDLFLSLGEYVRYRLEVLGLKDDAKVKMCHFGVQNNKYPFRFITIDANKEIEVVTLTNFNKNNRVDLMIQAIARVVLERPNVTFTIIGDGVMRQKMEELANELNVRKHINFVGKVSEEDEIALLKRSHIYLNFPSTGRNGSQEGVSESVKKAMAIGIPVISSYHGGILDLLQHEVTGIIVSENDLGALSSTIKSIINNAHKLPRMIFNAREFINKKYNIGQSKKQFENALLSIV